MTSLHAHQHARADDSDTPQAYGSDCNLARLVSIREMDALASMVITALPFPPLPLMVLQGTEGEGGTASSFDLLKQAIVLQKLKSTDQSTGPSLEQVTRNKTDRLRALQHAMQVHCSTGADTGTYAWIEGAYNIFCEHFRLFFVENYPTCSRDLRFESIANVSPKHIIIQQALSHARASIIMTTAAIDVTSTDVEFAQYEDVVKYYALDLGTLSDS